MGAAPDDDTLSTRKEATMPDETDKPTADVATTPAAPTTETAPLETAPADLAAEPDFIVDVEDIDYEAEVASDETHPPTPPNHRQRHHARAGEVSAWIEAGRPKQEPSPS